MSSAPVSQASAIVTAVCAAAFLGLAVVTAMAHEPSWIIATCSAAALASIVLTNYQLRILHARKTAQAQDAAPPS